MKTKHVLALVLASNAGVWLLTSSTPSPNQNFEKITVKELVVVGEKGERRAAIEVEPEGTVVLRMMDQRGTIRVKVAADEDGSGLVLLDESTDPAIHALAKKDGGSIQLQDRQGKKRNL